MSNATTDTMSGTTTDGPIAVAILGAGRIAHSMAATVRAMMADPRYSRLVSLYAVASRDDDRAREFADRHSIPVSYGSYDELLADPRVDLVYIATPHSLHAEQSIMCMRAGKAVLVEKAFTVNADQARDVIAASRDTGMTCVEAIWTRFMPSRGIIDGVISSGVIGEVQSIEANLGYPTTGKARLTDPRLAGGALLDVGVYPLNFIDMVMGGRPVARIDTTMSAYSTGVDAQNSMTLWYEDGTMAVATSSMTSVTDRIGSIRGTDGYILCRNINNVESIEVFDGSHQLVRTHAIPAQLTGYEYEVASTATALRAHAIECPEMPHADTLRMMELMDDIRERWGLRYPGE